MYCPSCGKQTPDNSAFCLNCGARIATPATRAVAEWDYKDFVWDWPKTNILRARIGVAGARDNFVTLDQAQRMFWQDYQRDILTALQLEIDQGWQPISEVGPASIEVYEYKVSKSKVGLIDVVLWIMTFGVMFLLQLLSGFNYTETWCEPSDIRVKMRRPKHL